MSSLDGQDLFGSGPHEIQLVGWQRALARRAFAGLDGELVLDLGLRSRVIEQRGRLQAATADDLDEIISQIEAMNDGSTHSLLDNHGRTHSRLVIESFQTTTALRRGRGFWCDYTVTYRQLP